MSAQDKVRVKAAVARFVSDPANTTVVPGDLAALVKAEIGLQFGASTIARYLAGLGWVRVTSGREIRYSRPRSRKRAATSPAGLSPGYRS